MRFAWRKWPSYFAAPLLPVGGVLLIAIPVLVLGWIMRAESMFLLGGLVWPLVLVGGFVVALLLLGLLYRMASDVGHDQHGGDRQFRCLEPLLCLYLPAAAPLPFLRGGGGLHRLARLDVGEELRCRHDLDELLGRRLGLRSSRPNRSSNPAADLGGAAWLGAG